MRVWSTSTSILCARATSLLFLLHLPPVHVCMHPTYTSHAFPSSRALHIIVVITTTARKWQNDTRGVARCSLSLGTLDLLSLTSKLDFHTRHVVAVSPSVCASKDLRPKTRPAGQPKPTKMTRQLSYPPAKLCPTSQIKKREKVSSE
jgi:hypothetical protein